MVSIKPFSTHSTVVEFIRTEGAALSAGFYKLLPAAEAEKCSFGVTMPTGCAFHRSVRNGNSTCKYRERQPPDQKNNLEGMSVIPWAGITSSFQYLYGTSIVIPQEHNETRRIIKESKIKEIPIKKG